MQQNKIVSGDKSRQVKTLKKCMAIFGLFLLPTSSCLAIYTKEANA
jgi:hypothetical protein